MKKAAVITIFRVENYGSVFQAYATQRILARLGYESELIDYRHPNEWHFRHGTPRNYKSPIKKLAKRLAGHFRHFHRANVERNLNSFIRRRLKLTRPFASLDALQQADWTGYNVIIAGSDQIWSPRFQHGDSAFMLSFVPENITKISMASSFAADRLPVSMVEKYRRYLSRFRSLSVRERGGQELLANQLEIGRPAKIMLDPTLLLSKDEWLSGLEVKNKRMVKQPYILLYMLTYAYNSSRYVYDVTNRLREMYGGCEVVVLSDNVEGMKSHVGRFINMRGVPPEDFVRLFRDARCVVTSSFHGTAFAINFGVPFISIAKGEGDDRQKSLLDNLGLEHCHLKIGSPLDNLQPEYDAPLVQSRLSALRSADLAWLQNAL